MPRPRLAAGGTLREAAGHRDHAPRSQLEEHGRWLEVACQQSREGVVAKKEADSYSTSTTSYLGRLAGAGRHDAALQEDSAAMATCLGEIGRARIQCQARTRSTALCIGSSPRISDSRKSITRARAREASARSWRFTPLDESEGVSP